MRRTLTTAAILLLTAWISIFSVTVRRALAAPPYTQEGTWTNTTLSITNTTGEKWPSAIVIWGDWTTGSNCTIKINNSTTNAFILANTTISTNTLSYIDGDTAIPWEDDGVLSFGVSSKAVATNRYFIQWQPK